MRLKDLALLFLFTLMVALVRADDDLVGDDVDDDFKKAPADKQEIHSAVVVSCGG